MDTRPKTRRVNRQRNAPATQPPRGAKQIVIPMTRQHYFYCNRFNEGSSA